jgi:cysteinyl-tRNA synthetase
MDLTKEFPLSIYNSLGREKQVFKPINPPFVGMYVCGPTVYGEPHLGHARAAVVFDIVFRYLKYLGYKVRYVRNITDVGHLEDELAGAGEDKVAKKARLEQLEPMEIVQKYTYTYHEAYGKLNTLPPSIEPSATGHIPEQIKIVETILKNGYAYEVNGSVYLDMDKYVQDYPFGQLSGKVLEDLQSGSRSLDGQSEKRDPKDFALWKKAKPEHIMKWDSPWGEGFPGWHLECTAMSSKYLGDTFDIHGGGMDLQFPHHEGEIAQSCTAHGKAPVNYWMHNNMLTIEGQKMAKSKGNFINFEQMITGDHDLLERAYSPMIIRYFMLQAHYRSPIDFGNDALQAAEKGYQKMMQAMADLGRMKAGGKDEFDLAAWKEKALAAMNDDFNTPILIAELFDAVRVINSNIDGKLELTQGAIDELSTFFTAMIEDVLGLEREASAREGQKDMDGVMQLVIDLRNTARANKDWATSDKIRDELAELGIQLKDSKEGTFWTQNG